MTTLHSNRVYRWYGQHNLCGEGECRSACSYTENATSASVCSRYEHFNSAVMHLHTLFFCCCGGLHAHHLQMFIRSLQYCSSESSVYPLYLKHTALFPENMLKMSLTGKKCHTPLPSGRKALVAVNKITSTPAVHEQKKHQKTQVRVTYAKDIKCDVGLLLEFLNQTLLCSAPQTGCVLTQYLISPGDQREVCSPDQSGGIPRHWEVHPLWPTR